MQYLYIIPRIAGTGDVKRRGKYFEWSCWGSHSGETPHVDGQKRKKEQTRNQQNTNAEGDVDLSFDLNEK